MRFPTMWYVRPAKAQTSLRIRAVWSEPCWSIEYSMTVKLLTEHHLEFKAKTEAAQARLSLVMPKCHIVGNHMSRLIFNHCPPIPPVPGKIGDFDFSCSNSRLLPPQCGWGQQVGKNMAVFPRRLSCFSLHCHNCFGIISNPRHYPRTMGTMRK